MQTSIHDLLSKSHLFDHLSPQEMDHLALETSTKHHNKDEIIITEGEIGDCLYLIVSGAVRVYTYHESGQEIVLARLETGHFFGEQALLTSIPIRRSANVRALTDVTLVVIPYETFQKCLKTAESLRKLLKEQGQSQLIDKLIKQTEEEKDQREILTLFNRIESFGERRVFFRQGAPSLKAYYVLNGLVEIRFFDPEKRLISRSLITPGHFFGELGVLKNESRKGTAVALTEVQAAVIDVSILQSLYHDNAKLKELIDASLQLYQIPLIGIMTQYAKPFLDRPAINTAIQLQNGESIVASRVIRSDLFAILYSDIKDPQKEIFKDSEDHIREIFLTDNRLVGVISVGKWDDLDQIANLIYNKQTMTLENLEYFCRVGKFDISLQKAVADEGILCNCMRIKTDAIQKMILEGVTDVDAICSRTGAGTVCGGCRPRIRELLGENIWIYVKIDKIQEHNSHVRSYQLRPLEGSISLPLAGQHIIIEGNMDGLWVTRSYTLTSIDTDKEFYEITVKREEQGLFSRWLFNNDKEKISLRVSTPEGTFIFPQENNTPILFFVAGIGITPAIAFAKKIVANQDKRFMHIDYSIRHQENSAFNEELATWPKNFSNISITTRLTSQTGHLNENNIQEILTLYPNADIFICGPKAFEETITETLNKLGISANKIHLERFIHAGSPLSTEGK